MKDTETYQEYKERVMDPISTSFCAAKWYNATIWLGSGMTTSCHHPLPHKIDPELVKSNPKLIHNTAEKKEARRQMLCGERPKECDYCWKVEDIKRNNVSDRTLKTVIYTDDQIKQASNTPVDDDVNLKTLEIAFDRTCNLACSYCNPAFSSSWVKDLKTNGPYTGMVTDGRGHFTHTHDSSQLFKYGEDNPYVNAFWEWWPELSESLQELRVTGGEPTMSADFWKLIDWFSENENKMTFAVNSNLCMKPELFDRLIKKSHDIADFHLYTSNESIGSQAEYIRDGLDWNQWCVNLVRLIEEGNVRPHVMMTINALCLYSITMFLDFLLELKTKFGRNYPSFSVNILRFPSFQSPLVLPDELRFKRKEEISKWLNANKENQNLHQYEIDQVQRLIDYLDVVVSPHETAANRESLEKDFKAFYQQYDIRRNKSFMKSFPNELTDWFENI